MHKKFNSIDEFQEYSESLPEGNSDKELPTNIDDYIYLRAKRYDIDGQSTEKGEAVNEELIKLYEWLSEVKKELPTGLALNVGSSLFYECETRKAGVCMCLKENDCMFTKRHVAQPETVETKEPSEKMRKAVESVPPHYELTDTSPNENHGTICEHDWKLISERFSLCKCTKCGEETED